MPTLRFITAGESHGPGLTAILEGLPAGLALDASAVDAALARRQVAFGAGGRMGIERDRVVISSGVLGGRTTGGPLALHIKNRDFSRWKDRDVEPMNIPRPGHADLVGALKYGYPDLRPSLERASARETAARVAVGAVCAELLGAFGISVGGYVCALGDLALDPPLLVDEAPYRERAARARANDLACPDDDTYARWHDAVAATMKARDTLGGVVEVFALGVPVGLGSFVHFDRKLDARIAHAMMSIQAMKGVEIGAGFAGAARRGTETHDEILLAEDGALRRASNDAGGIEGGVSTGAPIVVRVAMKPISTTLTPRRSVDLAAGTAAETRYERSDFCAVPRAVVVAEAMLAWVLADALLEKLGGDSLDEQRARFAALRRARLEDVALDNAPWRLAVGEPPVPRWPGDDEDDDALT